MTHPKLNPYKQEIADLYTRRSQAYDNSDWHLQIAHRLVEYGQVRAGQQVLDIATGTGMVALKAAERVGDEGRVVGVDISIGMLEQARRKAESLGLNQVEFLLADAEALRFEGGARWCYRFDRIFCASAFIWMSNLHDALCHWHHFLKPGGLISIHAFADTAFVGGVVAQEIAAKYGIAFDMSKPTGTVEKCRHLLEQAGFESVEVHVEPGGGYISLEKAKSLWVGNSHPAPGQYPHPLAQLSNEQLAQAKTEFDAELKKLQTEQGVWNDMTTFYVSGQKP
jgi:ubiquinone/menaquinone biosynthesis C-methylase UbiE